MADRCSATGACDEFMAALNHRPPLPSGAICLSWTETVTDRLVQLVPLKCSKCCARRPAWWR